MSRETEIAQYEDEEQKPWKDLVVFIVAASIGDGDRKWRCDVG